MHGVNFWKAFTTATRCLHAKHCARQSSGVIHTPSAQRFAFQRKVIHRASVLLCLLIGGLSSSWASAAPKYIQFKPMAETINTPVADVKSGQKTLPLITWGGDIATIYANGNQRNTAKGSIFAKHGLDYRLVREDDFATQVKQYLAGETPYLRGTLGMINLAADALNKDPRTKPVVFYQMTWSAGGDALVVKNSIKTAKDLKGKTIAVQAYGPHVDYLVRVLKDAGLSTRDVTLKWLPDLTGTDNAPMAAFYEKDVDAAFVIIPDALALTSGGATGTGAEASVKGARILMSTKTANRVIADVYAVRNDYYKAHQQEVEQLTKALMEGAEALSSVVGQRSSKAQDYKNSMRSAAEILLDAAEAMPDAEGLYADCQFVHINGNLQFFQDINYPRNFAALNNEINQSLKAMQLVKGSNKSVTKAKLNYKQFDMGKAGANARNKPKFDSQKVAEVVSRRQQQGALSEGELFSFEVYFSPNQNDFSADLYKTEFDRVVELAATYGGAIITVEGHSDPMGFLRAKKKGEPPVVLGRIKQSAKNLSISRAQSVRDAIVGFASNNGVILDQSQFEAIGHGIANPATGVCGDNPCAPKNEKEWRSNMRVVFRIIQIEAEADVFMPL